MDVFFPARNDPFFRGDGTSRSAHPSQRRMDPKGQRLMGPELSLLHVGEGSQTRSEGPNPDREVRVLPLSLWVLVFSSFFSAKGSIFVR